MPVYGERGYLRENYRLFHLAAPLTEEVDFHYHTFHKIVIPLKGTLSYMIEGRHYRLEAFDVALVGRGCVHKPETAESNERVLIYISSDFLREKSTDTCDLEKCYKIALERGSHILRLNHLQRNRVSNTTNKKSFLQNYALLIAMVVAIIAGCVIGAIFPKVTENGEVVKAGATVLAPLGKVFINLMSLFLWFLLLSQALLQIWAAASAQARLWAQPS